MAKSCVSLLSGYLLITFNAMKAQPHTFSCGTPHDAKSHLNSQDILAKLNTLSPPCGEDSIFHIRTAIHYFLRKDGTGNFNEFDDGKVGEPIPLGQPANYHQLWNGYRFAAEIVHAANVRLLQNVPLQSLHTSCVFTAPAVYPIKILYTLVGVYFHRVENNSYDIIHSNACKARDSLARYAVNPSNTLNIVLGPFTMHDGCAAGIPAPVNGMRFSCQNQWNMYNAHSNDWVNIVWGTGNWSTPTMNHQQGSTYSTSHIPAYKYQCNSCSPAYSFSRVHEKCGEVYLAGGWYGTWVTAQNQFIEIFETNAIGSHTVTGPYYANWFPVTSPSVYLRKLNSLYTFVPGKIYKIKLAVSSSCTGWHESSNWIRYSGAVSSSGCGGGGGSSPHRVSSWEDKIEVYPNPTTGTLSIFLGNVPQKAISVVLADVTGKVVATTTLQEVYTQWHVDVPQGMYILQIPELNYFEKIIVQQ